MKRNKFLSVIASVAVAGAGLMSTSCADDLDLKPIDYFSATGFWTSQDLFEGNITALMNQWRANYDATILYNAGEVRAGVYSDTYYLDNSSLGNIEYIHNNLSASTPQFSNFANFFGMIANINTFLYYAEKNSDVLNPTAKSYMEGMVYGMRAMCYFQLHKMYGTCPLRLEPDVMLGNYDPQSLYKARCTAEELLTQIKSDIAASLAGFNAGASYSNSVYKSTNGIYYWTKAATEMLAGEVYLWSGKVSTGDHKANPADVATAKTYFQNVVNNYGYALQNDYFNVWSPTNRGNKEIIFATRYDRDEATQSINWPMLFSTTTGMAKGTFWWTKGDAADTKDYNAESSVGCQILLPESTTATRLGYKPNAAGTANEVTAFFKVAPNFVNRTQYKSAYYWQYDKADSRRDMWIQAYLIDPADASLLSIDNFDTDAATLAGCFIYKYPGQIGYGSTIVGGSDLVYYRLPLAYMYLAEIANYEGNNSDVERYINLVRARAFGSNWDAATYGYTAGSFRENEAAILHEKDREFIMEGQRWWDLRRLTAVKGGSDQDHLMFQPEGCIGWGLNLAALPCTNEVSPSWDAAGLANNQIETNVPVMDYATQGYRVLWPLDKTLLGSDPELVQTPGYGDL